MLYQVIPLFSSVTPCPDPLRSFFFIHYTKWGFLFLDISNMDVQKPAAFV